MNLKTAREIARKVGATIEEKKTGNVWPDGKSGAGYTLEYIIRLGVVRIDPGSGVRKNIELRATSPQEAANLAVVETGRAARELLEIAKSVYVDSDLIFGAPK